MLWLIVEVGAGDGRCYAPWMDISVLPTLTRVLVTSYESSWWRMTDNDSTATVRLCCWEGLGAGPSWSMVAGKS